MIVRNAFNSILRTKGRTLVFLLLLVVLTAFLSLGASVWNLADRMLAECNETFTTIAVLEFMGADYPDEMVYDEELQAAIKDFPFNRIKLDPAVKTWDATVRALGYSETYERRNGSMPYRDMGVVYAHTIYKDPGNSGLYMGTVEPLYRFETMKSVNLYIDPNGTGFEPESGHSYLLHGEFFYGKTSLTAFRLTDFSMEAATREGVADGDIEPFTDVSDIRKTVRDDPDNPYVKLARVYKVMNSSFSVYATSNMQAMASFHQGEQYLIEGREFTRSEYLLGKRVCVLSKTTAAVLGVGVGDSIPLFMVLTRDLPLYESYWPSEDDDTSHDYEVVGIVSDTAELDQTVYIPKPIKLRGQTSVVGYTIGQALLKNGSADEFVRRVSPLLTERMRLTVYDQGYAVVARPIEEVRETASLVTLACIIAAAAVLLLFAYLFVYRQRETYEIFTLTGASTRDTVTYLLISCGLVALIGASLGAAGGYLFADKLVVAMFDGGEAAAAADLRYSTAGLGIVKDFSISTALEPSVAVFLISALAVIFAACALSVGFLLVLYTERKRAPKSKKKKNAVRVPAPRRSRPAGGALAYALTSIVRGGTRSLAAPAAALTIVIFISVISSTLAAYEARLDDVYTMDISAYATGLSGRAVSGLLIDQREVDYIESTGYVEDMSLSVERTYLFAGVLEHNGEVVSDYAAPIIPQHQYAFETWVNMVMRGPSVFFTNDMLASGEFFFSEGVETEFMDGFDIACLSADVPADGAGYCLVPDTLMAEYDLSYGDVICVWELRGFVPVEWLLRVVGSFKKASTDENIYAQLALVDEDRPAHTPGGGIFTEDWPIHYGSLRFNVTSTTALTPLKDALSDYGFSEVGRMGSSRTAIVVDDDAFIESVSSLTKHISRLKALYPALFALTMAIGYVVSYLLMLSRRGELAIMRLLGAQRTRVFFSFYLEQTLLCLAGAALALALWRIASPYTALQLRSVLIFIGCYFLGSALSVIVMNASNVMAALAERE